MNPAAILSVLVQARGIEETNRQLRKIDVSSRRTADSTGKLERNFHSVGGAAGKAGDGVGQLSVRVGALGGSMGSMVPLLATATPALIAFGGAAAAVAGSLGAAAAGAGALGAGLGASLAPILVVGKQVTSRFEEIKKAYDLVKTAQREGTAASKKNAEQALAGLSKSERAMVDSFGKLSDLQKKVLGPASDRVIGSIAKAIDTLAPSLGRLAKPFAALGSAIGGSIERIAGALSGPAWTKALSAFVKSAERIVGPITTIFMSIANIFRDVAVAALPLVQDALEAVGDAFRDIDKKATSSKIRGIVGGLVEQTRSWFGLFKEAGELVFRVFSGGAEQGQGLVDSLTTVIGKWNDFLASGKGRNTLKAFFDVTTGAVRVFGKGIGVLFDAVAVAFQKVKDAVKGVKDAFAVAKDKMSGLFRDFQNGETAISGIVGALGGIVLAVAGIQAYAAAVAVAAGVTKVWALAQAAFNAVFIASPVGIIVLALAALGAALVIAYQKSQTFRDIVNRAWSSIKDAATAAFDWLKTNIPAAFDAVKGAVSGAVQFIKGWIDRHRDDIQAFAEAWRNIAIGVGTAVGAVVMAVKAVLVPAMQFVWDVVKAVWPGIKLIVEGALDAIGGLIQVFSGVFTGDFSRIWDGVKGIFKGAIKVVLGILEGLGAAAWTILKAAGGLMKDAILAGLKGLPGLIWGLIKAALSFVVSGDRIANAAVAIGKAIGPAIIEGLGDLGHLILEKVKDALGFVVDNIPGISAATSLGSAIGKLVGDGVGRTAKAVLPSGAGMSGGSLMGAKSIMAPFASMAGRFGLRTSSGLRPGAITSSGNPSYHGTGNAIDEAGSPAGMLGYFKYLRSNFGSRLRELIYTPGGVGIKDGKPFRYTGQVAADHFDHVHVAFTGGAGDGLGRAPRTGDGIGEIKSLWTRAGGSSGMQNLAAAVAMAESGGNAKASNRNSDGSIDRGLWQINSIHGGLSTFNRLGNAKAAVSISSNGRNWNPWVAYKNGAYKKFLSAASKAPKGKTKTATSSPRSSGSQYTSAAVNAPDSPTYTGQGATDPLGNSNTTNLGRIKEATRPGKGGPSKGIMPGFVPLGSMDPRSDPRNGWLQGEFKKANAALALASLTADTGDDLAALQRIQQVRGGELDLAKASGDSDWIAEAATNFKSATDAIDQLTAATQENTRALQDSLDALASEMKRNREFGESVQATSNYQLTKTLADLVSGHIVGRGVTGRSFTPGSGTAHAY